MAILVGSVEVEVVPNTVNFIRRLEAELIPGAARLGNELGRVIGAGINEGIRAAVRDPLRNLPGNPGAAGARAGNQFGGKFNEVVQTRVRAALKALPTPKIGVDASEADRVITLIRRKLETLSNKTIGIDISAAAAEQEINRLTERLTRLNHLTPNIAVRVDTAAAMAELAAVRGEIERMDGRDVDVNVDVNTGNSLSRIQAIALAIAALGPALVPIVAVGVVGLAALGPAAVTAAAGIGVLVLAFNGVGDAITSTKAATDAMAADAAAAAVAQASAANALVGAQQAVQAATASLANTVASADAAAIRSARAVVDARAAVVTAVQSAAVANAAAARATIAAEKAVATAVRNTATAQRDLITARKEAARQLEDLASQQKSGAIDERQAVLDVADAQDALNLAKLDPKATAQSVAEAQVNYDRAVQNLEDTRTRNTRLASDKKAADKAGVEGSELVVSAQQRVLDTAAAEAKAREAATTASANEARVKVAGAGRVVAAEQAVTDALIAQKDQARQSAFAIQQSQNALASSQRSLATAQEGLLAAQTGTSAAAKKAADSMAALSPAGRDFVTFINAEMRPAIKDLRTAAQEGLLPGVQDFLESLLPVIKPLARYIGRLATAMGDLFTRAGEALKAPFWQTFFADLNRVAVPLTRDFGTAIGNVIGAFAGLVQAFIPVSTSFGGGLVTLTARFAKFTQGLSTNAGFKKFVDYATTNAPRVGRMLGSIGRALVHIGVAAAPLGVVVVAALKLLGDIINAIPTPVLTVLIGLLAVYATRLAAIWAAAKLVVLWEGLVAVATGVWTVAQMAMNGTLLATIALNARVAASLLLMAARSVAASVAATAMAVVQGVVSAATAVWTGLVWLLNAALIANPIGLVIIAIVAIIAIIVIVVKHFGFFKNAAKAAWQWVKDNWPLLLKIMTGPFGLAFEFINKHWGKIKAGASAVWTWIKDGFNALVGFFQGLPERIGNAAADLWTGFLDGFKSIVNSIIDIWNNLSFSIGGGSIGGVDFPKVTLDTPDIPHMAAGGIVHGPTVAMIGENGPEAVVPLNDSRMLAALLGQAGTNATALSGHRSGSVTVNQTINNPIPERAGASGPAGLRRAALALGV